MRAERVQSKPSVTKDGRRKIGPDPSGCTSHGSLTPVWRKNPKGIPSQSPGLRGTSYPGSAVARGFNPERVEQPFFGLVHSKIQVVTLSDLSGLAFLDTFTL